MHPNTIPARAQSKRCQAILSGVDTCPAPITLTTEGAGQSVSGRAVDRAGNSASSSVSNINIDKTPPRLTGCQATDITDTRATIRMLGLQEVRHLIEDGLMHDFREAQPSRDGGQQQVRFGQWREVDPAHAGRKVGDRLPADLECQVRLA